jgi:glutathione synthase/RimK-type ligase-like ATP-grasp enzyme
MELTSSLKQLGQRYRFPEDWLQARPYLFSAAKVQLPAKTQAEISAVIEAIESVIKLPAYQEEVLSWAPDIARFDPGISGVFFGYDFHLSPEGIKLIEINSNAGSAALAALLNMAQAKEQPLLTQQHEHWETNFAEMFLNEWRTKRGDQALSCVAIVDENPTEQYLYPDFLLFQFALQQQGIKTVIVDPKELSLKCGQLYHHETLISLVYNRLTDFSLGEPAHQALKEAYLLDAIVLTPHPRSHACYADKRNLTVLSNTTLLRSWGVSESQLALLTHSIPRVYNVDPSHAEELWKMRKQLFFKPVAGYGGKGAYRGAKMSRRVFNDILQANYVAQTFIPASEQTVNVAGEAQTFKLDVRCYVYESKPIGMIARLYQGQVTNMRTPGGGFAVVEFEVP